jgi:predicted nucleic-acid-binding Zn-ribbon protein
MALPKCPKCDGLIFEINEINVQKSNFKLNAINCAKCGAILGIHEYLNIGATLDTLSKKLGVQS